jgi:hypothetical protein
MAQFLKFSIYQYLIVKNKTLINKVFIYYLHIIFFLYGGVQRIVYNGTCTFPRTTNPRTTSPRMTSPRMTNPRTNQLLVSCGGGRRPVNGLRKQHVHTIRPLVWDTLEDLLP